jgi:hypothetical protein
MYKRIIFNKNLPLKKRLKNLVSYFMVRRGARLTWKPVFGKFYETNPDNFKKTNSTEEKSHINLWKGFSSGINLSTYRICRNISGVSDIRYIPEEIYIADIEDTLNHDPVIDYLANKSFSNHWFPEGVFPKDYFHNVDGEYLNSDLERVEFQDIVILAKKLDYPVVIKPNRDTSGGSDVFFPANDAELIELVKGRKNFVVQERIKQHAFFNRYNPHGLNTIRVALYRSVADNEVHALHTSMRMGRGGSLDNLKAGGIITYVKPDGFMVGYALDRYGRRFDEHPDTLMKFDECVPNYDELIELSKRVAHKIFYARIISLDACCDEKGNWRFVEANVYGQHTIKFAQNFGFSFFGNFTDEVIKYCINNHWALK